MKFPMLFKKTNTGAIQFWAIGVDDDMATALITTVFGQFGTDSPQETSDRISEGKNLGKKNSTSPFEQAIKEARSKWEKQKKKGYVESVEAAKNEELDALIEGGFVPMLAHKFSEQGHKIKYPCFVQPKLDGIRCVAIVKDGECTLWTRTRKPINSCPHIVQELEAAFAGEGEIILDGELYNHDFKTNFEHIVSMVRQDEPHEKHTDIQYHVYDLVNTVQSFDERYQVLKSIFETFGFFSLKLVETAPALKEDDVMPYFDAYRKLGYEGAMLRNAASLYVSKRSYNLQKVKEFDDGEFIIASIEEGRGKLAGHAIFVCKTDQGKEFNVKLKGETTKLKEYFDDHSLWQGKKLTVQYQGLTGKEGVPRFPVGIAIRSYE